MRSLRNSKGFTLLEVLVATTVTSMLLILLVTFMINNLVNSTVNTARADLLREAQLTLDLVGRDIRLSANADDANRWQDTNGPGGNIYGWQSNLDTLVLATVALDADNNILFDDPLHYISNKNNNIYFVSNGILYKRVLADPVIDNNASTTCPPGTGGGCPDDIKLVDTVTSFTVQYLDNEGQEVSPSEARSIGMNIELQKERFGRTINAEYSTRTVFRNE